MSKKTRKSGWYQTLFSRLPLPSQTRAQTANHIFDAMALIGLIAFIAKHEEPLLSFILFITVLSAGFACVVITLPKR